MKKERVEIMIMIILKIEWHSENRKSRAEHQQQQSRRTEQAIRQGHM